MKIDEIEIDPVEPFKNCTLGRISEAEALSQLIPAFDKGGVIGLNNSWGTGKTTFIKMWSALLNNYKYTSIYFNAWENDFEDNPLSALIAELQQKLPNSSNFEKLLKYGGDLFVEVSSGFLTNQLQRIVGDKATKTVENAFKASSKKIFEDEIEIYNEKKKSLKKFKEELQKFVSDNTTQTPLIFFIDELDRCRPNYSVKVLECIKHLFSIPNILFVLSIDKMQLQHAINGFYGSDKFDSEEYLRRFIDLEYSLPRPSTDKFITSLYKKLGVLNEFISFYGNSFKGILDTTVLFYKNLNLRKIEKLVVHLSIILKSKSINQKLIFVGQYLIYLKYNYPSFYKNILHGELSLKELSQKYYDIYTKDFYSNKMFNERPFITLEGQLMHSYKEYLVELNNSNLSLFDEQRNPLYPSQIDNVSMTNYLRSLDGYDGMDMNLNDILKLIELIK